MVRRSAVFGRARISLLKENASRLVFRSAVRFPITGAMSWTLHLILFLLVLLASFMLRDLALRAAISTARVFPRSVLWRTRMGRPARGCTGPVILRGGALTVCW